MRLAVPAELVLVPALADDGNDQGIELSLNQFANIAK
jgi:hypothetical protein